ncbi:MAG: TonB-dependent receptor [marine bacterium B5-7]|nr:MAG: TonB-dependent receptor [marine bacterium B5-7]
MLRFSILLSCFSMLFSLSLQSSAEDINSYDELVVTAFRTPTQLNAIGSAYTIITAEDIENRQSLTVSDLLRTVPGVEVDRSGPIGTQTVVRIRGGESNHTLVIIDGVVVNDESQGSIYNFADLMTTDIERIEVIRGAQSAVWGSEALSGVINIITKKGSGKTAISANLEAGSFNSKRVGGSISAGTDLYDYKISASKFNTRGTDIELSSDKDGYDNNRLGFSGNFRPNDDFEINSSFNHTSSEIEFDNCTLINTSTDVCESSNDFTYGSLKVTHNSFDYHWQNTLKTTFKLIDHENFANNTQSAAQSSKEYNLALQSSAFFRIAKFLDANHAFTLAYEFESTDTSSINFGTFGTTAGVEQNNTVHSLVSEYRISFLNRLHLSASGRHDDQSLHDEFTTYRTTAAFVIPETNSRLHGSYGTGFKNPTIGDTSSVFGTTFLGSPNLIPETSRSWDAGIEQSLFNDRIIFDATYFHERLEDEISTNFLAPTFTTAETVNLAGISKRRGYELSLSASLTDKTDLSASYTYTDAVQDQKGTGTFTREIRRPPHIASLNLNHRFYKDRANFNIDLFHNGDDRDTGSKLIKQYTLVNLAVSFDATKYMNVYAKIDNLTNQVYQSPIGFFSSGIAAYAGINLTLNP